MMPATIRLIIFYSCWLSSLSLLTLCVRMDGERPPKPIPELKSLNQLRTNLESANPATVIWPRLYEVHTLRTANLPTVALPSNSIDRRKGLTGCQKGKTINHMLQQWLAMHWLRIWWYEEVLAKLFGNTSKRWKKNNHTYAIRMAHSLNPIWSSIKQKTWLTQLLAERVTTTRCRMSGEEAGLQPRKIFQSAHLLLVSEAFD